MVNRTPSDVRKNGIYYTPLLLARTLVEPLITGANLRIIDPAYGDGALILAAEQVLWEKHKSKKRSSLFGCDLSPLSDRAQHLPASNFVKCDFFDYEANGKYDVVLMNPPYVRHHYLHKDKVGHYQDVIKNVFPLKRTSDLWTYFIVKATIHLKTDGSIGAILPWSFLHADYSVELRKWLISVFREMKVLVLGANLFNDAKERVVLVWMRGYGGSNKGLLMGTATNPNDHVKYHAIPREYFTRNRVNTSFADDALEVMEKYKLQYGFTDFGNYADISIGVVTGADGFFIKQEDELNTMGLDVNRMIPILTNSSQLCGFSINGNIPNSRLVLITKDNAMRFKDYIKYGESEQYHLRAHSQRREPWYEVKVGGIPDAFFPYRVSLIPYLILNNRNIQCTNSIHRIYFRNITPIEKKWIQVSLLSIPGQLSLEANSRVYGSGVLKIEPSSLKKATCYSSRNRSIGGVYNQISRLLQVNNKREAMRVSTDFIEESLGIDRRLSIQAKNVYEELLSSRKKKKMI
ncbi:MAG: N-6 DNA methylase [Syntrophorhabdaceae bacterium]|nr:N-6 DNA methylase [Syntrophorhabdaceae bacterium]MDD5243059.1 N-6 DNA methylase [Syntrophorhabdaceae bacterium]